MDVTDVELAPGGRDIDVVTADGGRRRMSATLLWAECPSAQGRVRRARGLHQSPPANLSVIAVKRIGHYGVNIAFSDGHARGIYPWSYLADIAGRPQLEDFIAAD